MIKKIQKALTSTGTSTIMFFRNLALVLALLFVVSVAGSSTFAIGFVKSPPSCDTVHGVGQGETCFDVENKFNLSTVLFGAVNPNLSCNALFVGQWLWVAGLA